MKSSNKKVGIIIGVIAAVVILVVAGLLFLFLGNSSGSADARKTRLDTPTNLEITQNEDGRYILTFSEVADAIRYEVTVDGSSKLSETNSFDVTPYLTEYKNYTFQVKAIYTIASFSSRYSDEYILPYTTTLATPNLQILLGSQLVWDSIGDTSTTYVLTVKYEEDGDEIVDTIENIEECSYNLDNIVYTYGKHLLFRFTVQAENQQNPEFVFPSGQSNEVRYYMTTKLDDFTIQMEETTDSRIIYFPEVVGADVYTMYIDDILDESVVFTTQERNGETYIVCDLTNNANAQKLGDRKIKIYASVTNEYADYVDDGESNDLNYTVTRKLPTPTGLDYYKQGSNLRITWDPVKDEYGYEATGYVITIYDANGNLSKTIETTGVLDANGKCFYDEPLTTRPDGLFKIRIQATTVALYYFDSDLTPMPENAYSAITNLDTPTGFSLMTATDGSVTATWNTVAWANQGYLVRLQQWDTSDMTFVGEEYVVASEASADAYSMVITSNYMPAGYYRCTIEARGYEYYNSSARSDPIDFWYKKPLTSPTILNFDFDTRTLTWTMVDNAVSYDIYVGSTRVTNAVISPLDDSTMQGDMTLYFADKQAGWYYVSVVAVADDSEDSLFINSAQSRQYSLSYMPKFATPTNLAISDGTSVNSRRLSWDPVNNASSYSVFVNGALVEGNLAMTETYISNYLVPGVNTIGVSVNATTSFGQSDQGTLQYEYYYVLQTFDSSQVQLIVRYDEGGLPIYSLSFPEIRHANKYSINLHYNDSLINTYTITDFAVNGGMVTLVVPYDEFVLFDNNTLEIVPGYDKPEGVTTDYVSIAAGTVWPKITFYNDYYLPAPQNLRVDMESLMVSWDYNLGQDVIDRIEGGLYFYWYVSGTGVGEGSIEEHSFDISDIVCYSGTDDRVSGLYQIKVYAFCSAVSSVTVEYNLAIDLVLSVPSNIVYADGSVSWDPVVFADSYTLEIQLRQESGEYTTVVTNMVGSATEWYIYDYLTEYGQGEYRFKVTASATYTNNDGEEETITSEGYSELYNFGNNLNTPTINGILVSAGEYYIDTNLVDNADGYLLILGDERLTFTVGNNDVITNGASVWLNITDLVGNLSAGVHNFTLQALDSTGRFGNSTISDPYGWEYYKTYSIPSGISIEQTGYDMDGMEITITWTPESVDGKYADYLITWSNELTSDSRRVVVNGLDDANVIITLASATDYNITIQAVPKENETYYNASNVYSTRFSLVTQFTAPQLSLVGGQDSDFGQYVQLANNFSQSIQFGALAGTTTYFSLQITNVVTGEKTYFDCYATVDTANYIFALTNNYFASAGVYTIQVSYHANGNYAASEYSNVCYIYYSTDFPLIEDIETGKTDTQVSVTFTEPTDTYSNITGYTISINFGADLSQTVSRTIAKGTNTAVFATGGDDDALVQSLLAYWLDGNQVRITIQTNFNALTIGTSYPINTFAYYTSGGATVKDLTIGTLGIPVTHFEDNGNEAVFSWDKDSQGYTPQYEYTLTITNLLTNAVTSQAMGFDENNTNRVIRYSKDANTPYKFELKVRAKITSPVEATSQESNDTYFTNALTGMTPGDFDVSYNAGTDTYTATWTNPYSTMDTSNGITFDGFTLEMGGYVFEPSSFVESGSTVSVDFAGETMREYMEAQPNTRLYNYYLGVGGVTYSNGNTVTLYMPNVVNADIELAQLVTSAVTGVTVTTQDIASWDSVDLITRYLVEIGTATASANYADFVMLESFYVDTNVDVDLSPYYTEFGLTPGHYVIRVSIVGDEERGVYVPPTPSFVTESYAEITVKVPYDKITGLRFNSNQLINGTTYNKLLSWDKNPQWSDLIDEAVFRLYITDSQNVNQLVDKEYLTLGYAPGEGIDYVYSELSSSIQFNMTDMLSTLPAGIYYASVMICGYDLYNDSPRSDAIQISNKFVLTQPKANSYTILPDAWVEYDEVSHTVSVSEDNLEAYNNYINYYGFNTKYLILTQKVDVAESLIVKVNGSIVSQIFPNEVAWDTSSDIRLLGTQYKLNISGFVTAGENVIELQATGNSLYYEDREQNVENSTLIETKVLYRKLDTPSINAVIPTYSDLEKTNVNGINFTFRNGTTLGEQFGIRLYKENGSSYVLCNEEWYILTLSAANFSGSNFVYNDMLDFVSQYGPGKYFFQVYHIANQAYYISSDIANAGTERIGIFDYKYRIVDFVVTDEGGILEWQLSDPNFDIDITYYVNMQSMLGDYRYENIYSATVKYTIVDGKLQYAFDGEHTGFDLDTENGTITFDMRIYFEDNVLRSVGYYLAGEYYFELNASPKVPDTYTTAATPYTQNYTYIIAYPGVFTDVVVGSDYNLTWNFTDDYRLGMFEGYFEISVNGYTGFSGQYIPGEYIVNILSRLTVQDNVVMIRARAPTGNQYYLDGEWVEADLSALPSTFTLPQFIEDETHWLTDNSSLTWRIEDLSEALLADPNKGVLSYQVTLEKLAADGSVEATIMLNELVSEATYMENYSLVNAIEELELSPEEAEVWLTGDRLIPASYRVTIAFQSTSSFYATSRIVLSPNQVNAQWQISSSTDRNYLYGDQVINVTESFLNSSDWASNDKVEDWLSTGNHSAYLEFSVILVDQQTPTLIYAKLDSRDVWYYYRLIDAGTNTWEFGAQDGSVEVGTQKDRVVFLDGENQNTKTVRVDVGNLFDGYMVAGAFSVDYYVGADELADGSRQLQTDERYRTVHVVRLPTLQVTDFVYVNNGQDFEINWMVSEDQWDIFNTDENGKMPDSVQFSVNITNTVRDSEGRELSTNTITDFTNYNGSQYDYYKYNSQDVANQMQTKQLSLTLNYYNYIKVQATTFGGGQESNYSSKFYLASEWSKEVGYMYLTPLGAPTANGAKDVFQTVSAEMAVEGEDNTDNVMYRIEFLAPTDAIAFEMYIYDPTDTDGNGNLRSALVHLYFGQDDSQDGILYLYDSLKIENEHKVECGKQVGTMVGNTVVVNGLTLADLLSSNYVDKTVNYVYSIKAWTNDYDEDGSLIYEFNKNHVSFNGIFQHSMKLQTPTINSVELVDNAGFFDVTDKGLQYLAYTTTETPFFTIRLTMSDIFYQGISVQLSEMKRVDVEVQIATSYSAGGGNTMRATNLPVEVDITGNYAYLNITIDPNISDSFGEWIYMNLPNTMTFNVSVSSQTSESFSTSFIDLNGAEQRVNYSYSNSDTARVASAGANMLTLGKQMTQPTVEILFDDLSGSLVEASSSTYVNNEQSNLFPQDDPQMSHFAANPYLLVLETGLYTWGQANASREYSEITNANYATYRLEISADGKQPVVYDGLSTSQIQGVVSEFDRFYGNSSDPSLRYNYASDVDLLPNISASLYTKLYNFFGSSGGGRVTITLTAIASDTANNWWVDSIESSEVVLQFYERTNVVHITNTASSLEVKESYFDCNDSEIVTINDGNTTTNDVYRLSKGNISVNWSKSANAQSYVTIYTYATNGTTNSQYKYSFLIDNTTTTSQDIVDLINTFAANSIYKGNEGNAWNVSQAQDNGVGVYKITVTPVLPQSVIDNYICGTYPSQEIKFINRVKLVNKVDFDITTGVTVNNNVPTANAPSIKYNNSTFNTSASRLVLSVSNSSYSEDLSNTNGYSEGYSTAVLSLLDSAFAGVTSGGEYSLRFKYSASSDYTTSNIFDSNYTYTIPYKYYYIEMLDFTAYATAGGITISAVNQSGRTVGFTNSAINETEIGLIQTVNGTRKTTTTTIRSRDSYSYEFNPSRADALDFSSSALSAVTALNGATRFAGNIQAGTNTFSVLCKLKSDLSSIYNIYYGSDTITCDYSVPATYSPSVSIEYDTQVKQAINDSQYTTPIVGNELGITLKQGWGYEYIGSQWKFYRSVVTAPEVTWRHNYRFTCGTWGATYTITIQYSVNGGSTQTTTLNGSGSFEFPDIANMKYSNITITYTGNMRQGFERYMLGQNVSNNESFSNAEQKLEVSSTNEAEGLTIGYYKPGNAKETGGGLIGETRWYYTSRIPVYNNTPYYISFTLKWTYTGRCAWENLGGILDGERTDTVSGSKDVVLAPSASTTVDFKIQFHSHATNVAGSMEWQEDIKDDATVLITSVSSSQYM